MIKVITVHNVYTQTVMDLCQMHVDANANGDSQVDRGLHRGTCDACDDQRADKEKMRAKEPEKKQEEFS